MKKCMRKSITIYLILAVLLTMLPACVGTAWAQNEGGGQLVAV